MSDEWKEAPETPGDVPREAGHVGPRVFTVAEAAVQIPAVAAAFEALDKLRERLKFVKKKMDVLEMIYGAEILRVDSPDRREYQHYLDEVETIRKQYEAECGRVLELGGYVKSVDEGLVDFYGVVEGRLVWLCWKRGDAAIEFYHHLEDGFAGRRPLPK